MLICTRKEEGLIALQAFIAGEDVRGDGGVGVADMRDIIHIVDRGCNVEGVRVLRHGV
jgi:hypothetical protein